jgi:hypothetical protein
MDNEGAGKGAGGVQDDGTAGGAGGGAGTGAEGAGAAGAGAAEGAGGKKDFDREKLHPVLRGMGPEEITELFETMATGLRTSRAAPPADDITGVPAHARPAPVRQPAKKEPLTKDALKEYFDPTSEKFDPATAFQMLAEQNYGSLLGDLNMRSIRGMVGTFRTELPDFADYEQEVMDGIAKSGRDPATISQDDVMTAYFFAKGKRATLKERQEGKGRARTTLAPTPAPTGPKKETELTELETTVARRMFRKAKDPVAEYRKFAGYEDGISVKVPTGGGKSE